MTLHAYFARRFLRAFGVLALLLCLLTALIELIEQIRILSDTSAGFADSVRMALLHAPETIYEILPLIAILATVATYLGLARSSEMVVVRAAGRSGLTSLLAPMAAMLVIGILALAVINPIVATTARQYSALRDFYRFGTTDALSISQDGLWLRQGGPEGQTVIRADRADEDGARLHGATFYTYAPEGGLTGRIEAEVARLGGGVWRLRNVTQWNFDGVVNPEAQVVVRAEMTLPSTLTVDRIREGFSRPLTVSVWDLPAYADTLEEAGFTARRHLLRFQTELARPVFLTALVMIAAAFTMRHIRSGRTGIAVLASVLVGFALHYIRNFAQILGENGQVPLIVAAWTPPVAAVMLALGLILHQEDA
ncbi:permease [Oceanicola sp. 22II-s10i]|uniref:LPS export ABC transporter permease LptG n=1 Tax=Oceanicola sp. 22II-s10i TaxID=1317116 RepID=UPI000B520714|nr:LPS export ABC transporter permease LptG [Oceanicola sp. 22II-s10i]OWU84865.1 permease [Oceanicola sp. 22II-s10i]